MEKTKLNSFRLTRTETYSELGCGPTPIPVAFTGQCSTDVVLTFKAENQQRDLSKRKHPSSETLLCRGRNK